MLPRTLHDAFFTQANKTPKNTAVTDGITSLTYLQLAQQAHYLAQHLAHQGYDASSIIGIYTNKRYEIIVAFLAISCIGGSCVQLDKSFAEPLLNDIIADTQATLLLADEKLDMTTPTINIVELLQKNSHIELTHFLDEYNLVNPDKGFWYVYSSGTTGKHKGIDISHRAILNSYRAREAIQSYDVSSQIGCNIYYLWEAFRPLIKGGTTHIISDDILYDFSALADYLELKNINEMLFTPSYLETLLHTDFKMAQRIFNQLKTCWLNGEVVSNLLQHHLKPLLKTTNVYNLYSISECHDVAVYRLKEYDTVLDKEEVVPAGYVLSNGQAVILDDAQQPIPNGEKGELYVYSTGLANGYINRPDLTAERFIEPHNSPIGKRLYRTGDYAKLIDNNLILIYGRCDYIVKLRGYTLSLPFIESVIQDKLNVSHCVLQKIGQTRMSESLVAYIEVPTDKQSDFFVKWNLGEDYLLSETISQMISPHLGHYMIPKYIVLLDHISLNAYSNKLDRNSIQFDTKLLEKTQNNTGLMPRIEAIDTLDQYKQLWSNLIGIKPEDIESSSCFFKLGGTSLIGMQLLVAIKNLGYPPLKITDFAQNSQLESSFNALHKINTKSESTLRETVMQDIQQAYDSLYSKFLDFKQLNTAHKLSHSKSILLTGATGFLGGAILKSLIEDSQFNEVICVLRAEDSQDLIRRKRQLLKKINVPDSTMLRCVIGDITQPKLGLTQEDWVHYANNIDSVIHSAASVNLLFPYQSLKQNNLDGTQHIIEFCITQKPKTLLYVSTNGILPLNTNQIHSENNQIHSWFENLDSGYAQSKWAAEQLVHWSTKQGLNAHIIRPGNLAHIDHDYLNPSDINWLLIQEIMMQKAIPSGLNLEMTPVTHVAHFLVMLAENPDQKLNVYNAINFNFIDSISLSQLTGYKIIDAKTWQKNLHNGQNKQLACLLTDDSWLDASVYQYQQKNYQHAMKLFGMTYPKMDKQQLKTYLGKTYDFTQK